MTRKIIITALTALTFATTGWTAESGAEDHSKERVGLAGGAIVGGLAGGPIGLVVGAALGGWLGDEFDTERRERNDFEARWQEAEATVASLNEAVIDSEHRLSRATATHRRESTAMRQRVREALDVQILFKTGASELADITRERLGAPRRAHRRHGRSARARRGSCRCARQSGVQCAAVGASRRDCARHLASRRCACGADHRRCARRERCGGRDRGYRWHGARSSRPINAHSGWYGRTRRSGVGHRAQASTWGGADGTALFFGYRSSAATRSGACARFDKRGSIVTVVPRA